MTFRIIALSLTLILSLSFQVEAQKFGHLNSGTLMTQILATTTAEKDLEVYIKKLEEETDQLQAAFDKKAKAFSDKYADGTIAQKVAEERYAKLQKEQESILKRRQEDQAKVLERRDLLMKPLFEKVQKAIDEVGKENMFTFIFDTDKSLFNSVLFVEESLDITALVKAKLGLK